MSFQRKSTGPRPPVPHGERCRAGGRRKLDSRSTRRWGSPAGFFLSAPNHLWNPDSATPCPDAPPTRCPAGQGGSEARSKKAGPTWCPWLDSQPYPLHRILPLSHPGSGIRPLGLEVFLFTLETKPRCSAKLKFGQNNLPP